ncbi:uncharacterized protein L969DRAFT_19339 [Mixia osmundae IAM 14324]|nr:uncharacterized protein L969DRAFT_19339 [Mixia osmundae IAM 14324]KEI37292.1 hypothetical protein L969DRAFT_19339 [Mixia osmundae IAM 14324]
MSFSNSTDLALFDQAHDLQRRGIGDTIIKYLKKGIQALPPLCELGNIFDLFNVDPNDTSLLSELEGLAGALCSLIVPKRNNNNKRMLSLPYAEERFAIDGGSMERKIELSPFALCYIEETELAHHRSCVWSGNVNRSDIWSSHVADDSSLRHVPVALAILSALHLLAAAIAVTQLIRNISGHRLHPSLHHSMRNAATVAILILCEMAVLLILAFRLGPPGSVRFASGFDALTGTTALAILGMVTTDRSEDQAYAYESASDPYEVVLSDDEKTNTPV